MDINVKIVGLGDGGARTISKIMTTGGGRDKSVEFMAVGNDENIMLASSARKNIFLNRDLTTIYKSIADALSGAKLIFIVAGLGGNAARTAVPIITSCAKNLGAVTVAFVCRPFVLENILRKTNAERTLDNLRGKVDTLFSVPAEKFFAFRLNQPQVSLHELFDAADDVFCQGVKIFLDMLSESDSELALFKWGNAAFGYGEATSAIDAIKNAATFPTFEENEFKHAQGIFVHMTSGNPIPKSSIEAANRFIKNQLQLDAEFFSQEKVVPSLGDKVFASIICTRK